MRKPVALGGLCIGLIALIGLMGGGCSEKKKTMILVDAPMAGMCSPTLQTGCAAGEKCTWIIDAVEPSVIGHVGCAPAGVVAVGGACTRGMAGPMGYDDCTGGNYCIDQVCKPLCGINGAAPNCATDFACVSYDKLFEIGTTSIAGVCQPSCNPLTQERRVTNTPACGSTNPAAPNQGCFGTEEYLCAGVVDVPDILAKTDRQPPYTDPTDGSVFINSCAPGYQPFLRESSTVMTRVCTGLCAALESDTDKPLQDPSGLATSIGDATALAKLPTKAAPEAGDATCEIGKKGSGDAADVKSRCVFLWPFLIDDAGMFVPSFNTLYKDTLGLCMAVNKYTYDSDDMGTEPDGPIPGCETLPPRTVPNTGSPTPGDSDDATDWLWCNKIGSIPLGMFRDGRVTRHKIFADFRLGSSEPMQALVRHVLQ
jgi:hypothetical protein